MKEHKTQDLKKSILSSNQKIFFMCLLVFIFGLGFGAKASAATYYASPTGSGTTCSSASPCTMSYTIGTKASSSGDEVVLKAGTYVYANGSALEYKGIQVNNVTVRGENRDSVILDFQNALNAGTSGWLYAQNKTGFTIKDFTIKNVGNGAWETGVDTTMNAVIYILGNSSGTIENIKFQDVLKRAIQVDGSATAGPVTIKRCEFSGIKSTYIADNGNFILIDGSISPVNVTLEANIFRPSAEWWGAGVWLQGTPSATRTVNFYNNEFYGTQSYAIYSGGNNYTGEIKNNIFIAAGVTSNVGGQKMVEGNCAGYAIDKVNYNINYGSVQSPGYYDSQITAGTDELIGDTDSGINSFPNNGYFILTYDDTSGFNTAGFNNYKAIVENNGWHFSFVANVESWDSRHGGITPTGATAAALIAHIAAGHDVAVHSFSHADTTVLTGAINIAHSGGAKNVTIETNTDNTGASDWGTIYKDYTTWTGTLTLEGETPINLINASGYFKTLSEVAAEITAKGNGWTATATGVATGQVSSGALAISLAEGVTSVTTGTNFSVAEDPYVWLETKYAKDRLEAIITAVIGSPYTVKSYGSPYVLMSARTMDALMEAGYLVARGKNAATTVGSEWDLRNIARFNIGGLDGIFVGADATFRENLPYYYLAIPSSGGTVYSHITHSGSLDHANEVTVYSSVFAKMKDLESRGLLVKSLGDFGDIVSNGTNCPVFSGTVGNDERRHCINTDLFNGNLQSTSSLIDSGTDVSLTTDYSGNPIYGTPDIGAYEYQPPYDMGIDEIDIAANVRVYGDGKFRKTETAGGTTADLSVIPQGSQTTKWLDITKADDESSLIWEANQKKWKESSDTLGDTDTLHTVGDLTIGKSYSLRIDDVLATANITSTDCVSGVCTADENGQITFTYTGGYSEHEFDITDDIVPIVTITDPETGDTVSGDDTITFTDSEQTDPQCSLNNTDWQDCQSTVTSFNDLTGWADIAESDTFTLYLKDTDAANNTGTTQVANLTKADTQAPIRSAGLPSGELVSSTTQTTLTLTTNENATCKYDTALDQGYADMDNIFTTTGETAHSQTITNLTPGTDYRYYVRCQDGSTNANDTDYLISFSIANVVEDDDEEDEDEEKDINIRKVKASSTENSITITWKTDHNAKSTVKYGTDKNLKQKKKDNKKEKSHKVILKNLLPDTKYYFKIKSIDEDNNEDSSRIHSIKTKPVSNATNDLNITKEIITPSYAGNASPNACSYTVQSGDTLWNIAKQVYGDPTAYPLIIEKNKDKYPDIESKLSIGQELSFGCSSENQGAVKGASDMKDNAGGNNNTETQNSGSPIESGVRWWNPWTWF